MVGMDFSITLDYELFGDGSGDVFQHIIKPTNGILKYCDFYGVKLTIFFEIVEYLKLKEQCDKGNMMGYTSNPIVAIDKQIQEAILQGHDIQLHVHPQWLNAKYSNGFWELDYKNWRLGGFNERNKIDVKQFLKECKEDLEKLVCKTQTNYKCIAIRAGGYNIMPSYNVVEAAKEIGLLVDSSVYPGGFVKSELSSYDYSKVTNELDFWWADKHDIREASNQRDILEFPIFSLPVSRWKRFLNPERVMAIIKREKGSMSALTKEKTKSLSFFEKIIYLLEKEVTPWDVCLFSRSMNKYFFSTLEKHYSGERKFIVLIGHPKSLSNGQIFGDFLKLACIPSRKIRFKTIKEKYEEVSA